VIWGGNALYDLGTQGENRGGKEEVTNKMGSINEEFFGKTGVV